MMSKILLGVGAIPLLLYIAILFAMYCFQDRLLFLPKKLSADHQFLFTRPFEEIFLDVEEATLNLLIFEHPSPVGTIIYFHGNAGALDTWGSVEADFARFPYHFVIYDYRGYGKSTGINTSEAQLQKDAEAVSNYVIERFGSADLVLIGRSLGTGIASWLGSRVNPKRLILETPYTSLPNLVKIMYPFVPKFLVKYQLNNQQWIQNTAYPVDLIHGNHDQLIPHRCSQRLAGLDSHITLHTITNAAHNNLSSFKRYHEVLNGLLSKSL